MRNNTKYMTHFLTSVSLSCLYLGLWISNKMELDSKLIGTGILTLILLLIILAINDIGDKNNKEIEEE